MNPLAAAALATLVTLLQLPGLAQTKANIIAIAQAAGLAATSFILGEPSERWIEIAARMMDAWGAVPSAACKGFFLWLATDPGDPGDQSADQTPRAGWLSALGAAWFFTFRGNQTFATGFVTVTNTSGTLIKFAPMKLSFERNFPGSDGGGPTYRNSPNPAQYTNVDGTLSLASGASITIPVQADQIGTYANAPATTLSILVTQSFGAMSVTNGAPVLGTDREEMNAYRTRCQIAPDAQSPGGPGAAYVRAATTADGGAALQRFDGSGPVSITRVYVSPSSATGTVTVYFAGPGGPSDTIDVSSANANITGLPLGVITSPIGVLPDCVTIGPTTNDPNTGGPGGAAATAAIVGIGGSVKVRRQPGGPTAGALRTLVQTAVYGAHAAYFATIDIGGLDQVNGAGVVYTSDLVGITRDAYPGIYDPALVAPSAPTTAIAVGEVPVAGGSIAVTGAATNLGSGVRLVVSSTSGLVDGDTCAVLGCVTSGGLVVNGLWVLQVVDGTHVDLVGSVWTGAFVSAGTLMYFGVTVV